jgi:hypothetical protein
LVADFPSRRRASRSAARRAASPPTQRLDGQRKIEADPATEAHHCGPLSVRVRSSIRRNAKLKAAPVIAAATPGHSMAPFLSAARFASEFGTQLWLPVCHVLEGLKMAAFH